MLKELISFKKAFRFEGFQPTWVAANGNIMEPRFYLTMKEFSTVLFYRDTRNNRHTAQVGRVVFTTTPK